jgi:TetR/AcrR family transcriptional regulator, upper aerobic nicotinate degradation pathway regulator
MTTAKKKIEPRALQARAVETREAILKAAIRIFAKHGFSGGRIEQISKLAKTHDRMIYYYFGSKEKLFIEVLETIYQRLNDAEAALEFDLADPVEAMRIIVRFNWQYYVDHPEFITLLNSENLHQGKHVKKSARVSELSSPAVNVLAKIIKAGIQQGLFRTDLRARDLYLTIAALGYFYLSNRHTLSAFLNTDLLAKKALASWQESMVDTVLRKVMR